MSWRQAAESTSKLRTKNLELRTLARAETLRTSKCEVRSFKLPVALVPNVHHLFGMKTGQKRAGRVQLELRIGRFDDEEELVLARHAEARVIEHRVIRLRQAIQREHADDRRERREENRRLERGRNERAPGVVGPARNVHRIRDDRRPVLKAQPASNP